MKKHIKTIVFITISFIVFVIFARVLTTRSAIPPVTDYGITILHHGIYNNLEAQHNFMKAYQQGKSSRWQKTIYTIEGDPIFYTAYYNQETNLIEVFVDTRQDSFGAKAISKYICESITVSEENALLISGCTNAQIIKFIFHKTNYLTI